MFHLVTAPPWLLALHDMTKNHPERRQRIAELACQVVKDDVLKTAESLGDCSNDEREEIRLAIEQGTQKLRERMELPPTPQPPI